MKKIKIPTAFGHPSVTISINDCEYVLRTGKEIEVEDFIAEFLWRTMQSQTPYMEPVTPPYQLGTVSIEVLLPAIEFYFEEHPVDAVPDEQVEAAVAWYMEDNPEIKGIDGKDGTSCTHYWNGTTLVMTSASGTSSANLKGDRGDTGEPGPAGANGKDGEDGADGKTPVKGTDYFTDADKAEMVSAVIAQLPVYGGETE